ncbi:MAG: hypothetical protein KBE09_01975 [Candidatus Pacebacteria bacterium]|nr:hypothetical protein [Candidatus Paceibacterota bacterium]
MADTPDEQKDEPDDALPDVHTWIGNRFNDDTIDDVIRIEEVPVDDPHFEMGPDDTFTPNAVDDTGEEIEIMEIVIRVFRRKKEE